jgi:hypothetical protein
MVDETIRSKRQYGQHQRQRSTRRATIETATIETATIHEMMAMIDEMGVSSIVYIIHLVKRPL